MKYRETMIAAAFSLVLAGTTVAAQENVRIPAAQPATDQDPVPGLRQTPGGEPMRTASDKVAPKPLGSAAPTSSTGPTFPNGPAPK